jgi:hypothetical protein
MSEHIAGRSNRTLTTADLERLETYRRQIEADLPQLQAKAREVEQSLRDAAIEEHTVSGQMRRAIVESGVSPREIAAQLSVPGSTIAEYMVGLQPLDLNTFDRLAALLKQELRPIHAN